MSLGSFRWHRDGDILTVQWIDTKVVTVMSTIHSGSDYYLCKRHTKVNLNDSLVTDRYMTKGVIVTVWWKTL